MGIRRKARGSAPDVDRQLSSWSRRRLVSWGLFVLAGLVAVVHLLAHAGWRPVPLGMGAQDIFIGYPAALLLLVLGGIALDPNPRI